MSLEDKKIKCITCNTEFDIKLETKPFCSKRCSNIDLNNWLNEKYSIHLVVNNYEKDI